MFKGIIFFIREGWKYDKLYILWRVLGSLLSALMPVAAALMPKYIIDELMGLQHTGTLITYVALFAGYAYLAGALNSFFSMDGFTRRCDVGKEFDMQLNRKLMEADYRSFNRLVGTKSAVYISHRMSSTRFCDAVAVLNRGCLVEYGTHKELLEHNSYYAELYSMQAQYYTD